MTADEARNVCGMFGCIEGREEKCKYPIKIYGTIVVVDSYNLLFNNTNDELVFFRLRYVEKFGMRIKGKRMLIIPHKFKKYVTLLNENQRSLVNVVYDSEYS